MKTLSEPNLTQIGHSPVKNEVIGIFFAQKLEISELNIFIIFKRSNI